MKPIRTAIIGAGHLGTIHTRLLQQNPRFDVVGVIDPNPTALARIKAEFDLPVCEDARQLDRAIDAAVIASPTRFHYANALQFLERSIHVLIEKPIAISVQEADHLNQVAKQHGLTVQVGHNERFNPTFVTARKLMGEANYIEAARTSTYTFRSIDVGVVFDLMIHDLDLVLSLVNSPVARVDAIGTAIFGKNEDMAQARIHFSNGSVANLTASRCSFERQRWIRWFSEDGFVSANLDDSSVKSIAIPKWLRNKERELNALPQEQQAQIRDRLFDETLPLKSIKVEPANAIQLEHDNFYDSIHLEREPLVSGTAGRNALAVAEQIVESINSHRWHQTTVEPSRKAA